MIHNDTQKRIEAEVKNCINWYFEEKERSHKMQYMHFKRWVFAHIKFDGLSEMYECIIKLQVDVENDFPKTIKSISFPVTIPERDYPSTANAITMNLLATAQDVYLSDLTRDVKQ